MNRTQIAQISITTAAMIGVAIGHPVDRADDGGAEADPLSGYVSDSASAESRSHRHRAPVSLVTASVPVLATDGDSMAVMKSAHSQEEPERIIQNPFQWRDVDWLFPMPSADTAALFAELQRYPVYVTVGDPASGSAVVNEALKEWGIDQASVTNDAMQRLRAMGLEVHTGERAEYVEHVIEAGAGFTIHIGYQVIVAPDRTTSAQAMTWSVSQILMRLPQFRETTVESAQVFATPRSLFMSSANETVANYRTMMDGFEAELSSCLERSKGLHPIRVDKAIDQQNSPEVGQDEPERIVQHPMTDVTWTYPLPSLSEPALLAELRRYPVYVDAEAPALGHEETSRALTRFGIDEESIRADAVRRLRALGLEVHTGEFQEYMTRVSEAGAGFSIIVEYQAAVAQNGTAAQVMTWSVSQPFLRVPQLKAAALAGAEIFETSQHLGVSLVDQMPANYRKMMNESTEELKSCLERSKGLQPTRVGSAENSANEPEGGHREASPTRQLVEPTDAEVVDFPEYTTTVDLADDLRGRTAPPLHVEEWLTPRPDISDELIVLEFWCTCCGPSRASLPHMSALADQFRGEAVFVRLTDENTAVVEGALKKGGWLSDRLGSVLLAIDTSAQMQHAFGLKGTPHVVVISSDWVVRWQGHPRTLTDAVMEELVKANTALAPAPKADEPNTVKPTRRPRSLPRR